jgi:hypothetical protein
VSGAASSAARSSWAIPVSRLLRSIENLHRQFRCKNPTKDDSST